MEYPIQLLKRDSLLIKIIMVWWMNTKAASLWSHKILYQSAPDPEITKMTNWKFYNAKINQKDCRWDFNYFVRSKELVTLRYIKENDSKSHFPLAGHPLSRWQYWLSLDGTLLSYSEAIIDTFKGLLKYFFIEKRFRIFLGVKL